MSAKEIAITQQQYRRLVARLDTFELAETERERAHEGFRRDVIEATEHQLEEQRKGNALLEKLIRKQDYLVRMLETRPCVVNERGSGDEECPEGHG